MNEAVRAGASGATSLVFKNGKLIFPGGTTEPDQERLYPLFSVFNIEENDLIIIGTAHSYEMAERGAISAALSLGEQNYQCNWNSIPGSGIITSDTDAEDLKCIALAIHEMVGRIPLTMRSRNHYGLRCEGGEVIDTKYTGPVLEEALKKGTMIRKMSPSGVYHGIPVVVAPIIRKKETVAVIGIVDITKGGIFDLSIPDRKK